jgi:hypothetical protein
MREISVAVKFRCFEYLSVTNDNNIIPIILMSLILNYKKVREKYNIVESPACLTVWQPKDGLTKSDTTDSESVYSSSNQGSPATKITLKNRDRRS